MPAQVPAVQTSPEVQRFPSVHEAPSALVGLEQRPVPGSHVPASWQALVAVQTTGLPPTHEPAPLQVSVWVQPLPSLQAEPLALLTVLQVPTPSQVELTWHSLAAQLYDVPPQAPAVQTSLWVQLLPSLQTVPLALVGLEQAPVAGLQVPAS